MLLKGMDVDTGKPQQLKIPTTFLLAEVGHLDALVSYEWVSKHNFLVNGRRHGICYQRDQTSDMAWVPGVRAAVQFGAVTTLSEGRPGSLANPLTARGVAPTKKGSACHACLTKTCPPKAMDMSTHRNPPPKTNGKVLINCGDCEITSFPCSSSSYAPKLGPLGHTPYWGQRHHTPLSSPVLGYTVHPSIPGPRLQKPFSLSNDARKRYFWQSIL